MVNIVDHVGWQGVGTQWPILLTLLVGEVEHALVKLVDHHGWDGAVEHAMVN